MKPCKSNFEICYAKGLASSRKGIFAQVLVAPPGGELGVVGQEGHLALIGVSADGAAIRNCRLHRENIRCKHCLYRLLISLSIWIRNDEEMMMK